MPIPFLRLFVEKVFARFVAIHVQVLILRGGMAFEGRRKWKLAFSHTNHHIWFQSILFSLSTKLNRQECLACRTIGSYIKSSVGPSTANILTKLYVYFAFCMSTPQIKDLIFGYISIMCIKFPAFYTASMFWIPSISLSVINSTYGLAKSYYTYYTFGWVR